MVTLEEALKLLKENAKKLQQTEEVGLMEALGRSLAEDLCSCTDQPPFPRSPLDGYAICARDIAEASGEHPAVLNVCGELLAGDKAVKRLNRGQAVRIMTGAPIPDGADAVVRQEDTDYGEERVHIYRSVKAYENYCFQGEDFKAGEKLISRNEILSAAHIALAAGMGHEKIRVKKRPKIAVITTGSELQEPGHTLMPGQIYNSNRYLAEARLREWKMAPFSVVRIEDEAEEAAAHLLQTARQADLVITTGGVSVGKKDIMHEVLERIHADKLFWKLQMKPGSPVLASVYEGTGIISLSGNPFGAAVGLEVLVRPVLYHMTGEEQLKSVRTQAVMGDEFRKKSKVRRFVRAILKSGMVYVPSGSHSSGALSSMKDCNCLIDIPAGDNGLGKGDNVWVTML